MPEFEAVGSKPREDGDGRQEWDRNSWDPFLDPLPEAVRVDAGSSEVEEGRRAHALEEIAVLRERVEEMEREARSERALREGAESALVHERGVRETAEDALVLAEEELREERKEAERLREEIGLVNQVGCVACVPRPWFCGGAIGG